MKTEEDEAFEELAKRQGDWGMQGSRKHQILRYLEDQERKPLTIAWYDPSNGVVSTDQDCPLFTPLGQVWPLYPKGEWVGLTLEDREHLRDQFEDWNYPASLVSAIEAKLKEKNT